MRRFLRFLPSLTLLVGVGMILVGCSEKDVAEAQAAAAAAQATGNPLLMLGGLLTSFVASHFISKSNDVKFDAKEYNDDDIAAMVRGLEKAGYMIQKRGG